MKEIKLQLSDDLYEYVRKMAILESRTIEEEILFNLTENQAAELLEDMLNDPGLAHRRHLVQ